MLTAEQTKDFAKWLNDLAKELEGMSAHVLWTLAYGSDRSVSHGLPVNFNFEGGDMEKWQHRFYAECVGGLIN